MGENSKIEWTEHTFNPWMGCTKVSPACDGCYAEALMDLRYGKVQWGPHGERVRTAPTNWKQPIKWDKAAAAAGTRPRVFCASLADVFDNQVPPEWRADLFALIRSTPNLIWLLLTKRPQNIVKMVAAIEGGLPPNAALGTTVEDQQRANLNVPALLGAKQQCNPAFAFLSCEPLLGHISLHALNLHTDFPSNALRGVRCVPDGSAEGFHNEPMAKIDWVITGGETDQGKHKARPAHPDWFRSLRDQCAAAGVAFHFKQWGEWKPLDQFSTQLIEDAGIHAVVRNDGRYAIDAAVADPPDAVFTFRMRKKAAGRLLDGVEHNGMPG